MTKAEAQEPDSGRTKPQEASADDAPKPQRSKLAAASLVLGLLGLVTFGVTAAVGLVLGVIGLISVALSGGRLRGLGLAIAGVCVSAAMMFVGPAAGIATVAWVRFAMFAKPDPGKEACAERLQAIAAVAGARAEASLRAGGKPVWPESLISLATRSRDVRGLTLESLRCPTRDPSPAGTGPPSDYGSLFDAADFVLTGLWPPPSHLPLAWDRPGNHPDGFHVVYFDGHVVFFLDDEGQAEWTRFQVRVSARLDRLRPDDATGREPGPASPPNESDANP